MDEETRTSDTPLQSGMRGALDLEAPPRPRDPALQGQLKELLRELLGEEVTDRIRQRDRTQPLWVDRIPLSDVLGCERYFVEEFGNPFEYTIQKARTQVAGAMLKRWAFRDPRRDDEPLDAVEAVHELLDELAHEGHKLGAFVAGLSEGGRADMASAVSEVVDAFAECWPADYRPRHMQAMSPLRANLYGGRLVLAYKVGFRFGRPGSENGQIASSVVLLDMRPGRAYEYEERANRWYAALLEVFKSGVAPSRVATWYAETQEVVGEDVDDAKLEAATRRVAEAIRRMVELGAKEHAPNVNPGWRCSFCQISHDCASGTLYLSTSHTL